MSFFKKALLYSSIVATPLAWYKLGLNDKNHIRKASFNKGRQLSSSFKQYPAWDKYVEPFFVKQFSILFTASHCFIEGMVSDNDNLDEIKKDLKSMHKDIEEEFEFYDPED